MKDRNKKTRYQKDISEYAHKRPTLF